MVGKDQEIRLYVDRATSYNFLTIDVPFPLNVGPFVFYEYPDEAAMAYHLGTGDEAAVWDARFPKWFNYLEFPVVVHQAPDAPGGRWREEGWGEAARLLWRLVVILRLFTSTPVAGKLHGVRCAEAQDFAADDVEKRLGVRNFGGDPTDLDLLFVTKENHDQLQEHFGTLWDSDWSPIQLAVFGFMDSFKKDLFAEGFEPANAFTDLMIALETLLSTHEAVGYKVALRAACLLESRGEGRQSLNKEVKQWYRKRNEIAHGHSTGQPVAWTDVERMREVVRRIINEVWRVQTKGDDLDDRLFLAEIEP